MNKLTEIKQRYEKKMKSMSEYMIDPECVQYMLPLSDFEHLISLLEEKDKALTELADRDNYMMLWDMHGEELGLTWISEGKAHELARKALNTPSNSEGE